MQMYRPKNPTPSMAVPVKYFFSFSFVHFNKYSPVTNLEERTRNSELITKFMDYEVNYINLTRKIRKN